MKSALPVIILSLLPAVASAQEATPGALEVQSDPAGAEVLFDGKPVGVTPVKIDGVAAGTHQVKVSAFGRETLDWTVSVAGGGTTVVSVTLPARAAAPETPAAPVAAPVSDAWKDLGRSVLDVPWAAVAVGVTFGLFLVSAVLFTTTPADVPGLDSAAPQLSDRAWKSMAMTAAVGGVLAGSLALVLLLLRLEPVERAVNVVKAMSARASSPAR